VRNPAGAGARAVVLGDFDGNRVPDVAAGKGGFRCKKATPGVYGSGFIGQ
jgi:hypothetical protein